MSSPIRTYRVWHDGVDWRWQVIDGGQVVAHGYATTCVSARVQALLFAISSGTVEAKR